MTGATSMSAPAFLIDQSNGMRCLLLLLLLSNRTCARSVDVDGISTKYLFLPQAQEPWSDSIAEEIWWRGGKREKRRATPSTSMMRFRLEGKFTISIVNSRLRR